MSSSRVSAFTGLLKVLLLGCTVSVSAILLGGCASTQPVSGLLYSDVAGPVAATSTPLGPKHGTSCASSILGLVATGDASITTAAKAGGVGQISHVEQHSTSIWFLYNKYCVDVWGWAPRGSSAPPTTAPAGGTPPPPPAAKPGASMTPATGGTQQTADIND